MSVKAARLLLFLFLASYFIVGNTARLTVRNEEQLYLISSWYLYSRVPAPVQTGFAVLIHSAGTQTFTPPVYLDDERGVVFNAALDYNHSLVHNVDDLGRALQLHHTDMILKARRELEQNFIQSPVVYDLVEISFHPVERWKSGALIGTRTVATFTSGIDD